MPSLITSEPWFLCVLLGCDSTVSSELQISPAVPCFYFHQLSLTLVSVQTIAMVRTRGGSRLRPRVRFSTPEREEQGPVPAPILDPVPAPVQSLRSLRGSKGTRCGWDPGPRHLCLSGDLRGPGPPSGLVHQARVSHPHPDLSRHQPHQQQRRHHRHSCRLPPRSGGRYSSGTPSRGMCGSIVESFIRSRIMMSRR